MSTESYQGTEILELLQYATNYNSSILKILHSNIKPTDNVCDFGAGIGTFAKEINCSKIICIEPSTEEQKHLSAEKLDYLPVLDDLDESTLDVIYSLNVLEHIENDSQIINTLTHKLKNNGTLILYLPAMSILWSHLDESVNHYRRYDKEKLYKLLGADYAIDHVRYCDPVGGLFTLLFKLLRKKTESVSKSNILIFDRLFFPFNKILEPLTSYFFGKNIYVVARKI